MEREGERHFAGLAFRFDGGIELFEKAHAALGAEAHDVADGELARRLDERLPARAVEPLDERRLDPAPLPPADAPAVKLRRDHLGVVDDELVARAQQLGEIAHAAVLALRCRARPHHQQPRRIARARRPQRDVVGRKLEVEQVGAHGFCRSPLRGRPFRRIKRPYRAASPSPPSPASGRGRRAVARPKRNRIG